MSILGKYTDENIKNEDFYVPPAVLKNNEGGMTLKKSIIISI